MAGATPEEMVDLDEPRLLLNQLVKKYNPKSDKEVLSSFHSAITNLHTIRQQKINTTNEQLSNLNRKIEIAKWEATRQPNSVNDHLQKMNELDKDKFEQARLISQNDDDLQDIEADIRSLERKVRDLEDSLELKKKPTEDEILANFYSGLGVEFLDLEGQVKCRVSCNKSNDIVTFPLEELYSDSFYANYLWQLMSQ